MSGHKVTTVTISQEEYRRLYEAEKSFQYSYDELLRNQGPEREAVFSTIIERLEVQNESQMESIQNGIQIQGSQRIEQEVANLGATLQKEIKVLTDSFNNQDKYIQDQLRQSNRLSDSLNGIFDQLHNEVALISNHFEETREQKKRRDQSLNEVAIEYLIDLEQLLGILVQQNLDGYLSTEELDRYLYVHNTSSANIENGMYETAVSMLQSAIWDATILFKNVELEKSHMNLYREVLTDRLYQIHNYLAQNSVVEALTKDGLPSDVFLDLNEWSDGLYQQLLNELISQEQWFYQYQTILSLGQLKTFEEEIELFEEKLNQVIGLAHFTAINTQMKYEIAHQVLLALVEQGYEPIEGEFKDGEGGERYYARAKSVDGNYVTVLVDQDKEIDLGSKVSILSSDYQQRTQHELNHRAAEIKSAIQQHGYSVGDLIEIPTATKHRNQHRSRQYTHKNL